MNIIEGRRRTSLNTSFGASEKNPDLKSRIERLLYSGPNSSKINRHLKKLRIVERVNNSSEKSLNFDHDQSHELKTPMKVITPVKKNPSKNFHEKTPSEIIRSLLERRKSEMKKKKKKHAHSPRRNIGVSPVKKKNDTPQRSMKTKLHFEVRGEEKGKSAVEQMQEQIVILEKRLVFETKRCFQMKRELIYKDQQLIEKQKVIQMQENELNAFRNEYKKLREIVESQKENAKFVEKSLETLRDLECRFNFSSPSKINARKKEKANSWDKITEESNYEIGNIKNDIKKIKDIVEKKIHKSSILNILFEKSYAMFLNLLDKQEVLNNINLCYITAMKRREQQVVRHVRNRNRK